MLTEEGEAALAAPPVDPKIFAASPWAFLASSACRTRSITTCCWQHWRICFLMRRVSLTRQSVHQSVLQSVHQLVSTSVRGLPATRRVSLSHLSSSACLSRTHRVTQIV